MDEVIKIHYYQSPVGELIVGSYNEQLCLCDWRYRKMRSALDARLQKGLGAEYREEDSHVVLKAIGQLNEYFDRKLTEFDLPLLFVGTEFQKSVWNGLLSVKYGTTESYMGLSKRIGNPQAIRAVASANGANAISIIVPCHRIIGSNGELVGYAGGLQAKKKLLQIESPQDQLSLF